MLYRLRIDLAFGDKAHAHALAAHARSFLQFAQTINPDIPALVERGFVTLEECHHNEDPQAPCVLTQEDTTP
jgi:hypothetical protein